MVLIIKSTVSAVFLKPQALIPRESVYYDFKTSSLSIKALGFKNTLGTGALSIINLIFYTPYAKNAQQGQKLQKTLNFWQFLAIFAHNKNSKQPFFKILPL